jgi:hypothetical protein
MSDKRKQKIRAMMAASPGLSYQAAHNMLESERRSALALDVRPAAGETTVPRIARGHVDTVNITFSLSAADEETRR